MQRIDLGTGFLLALQSRAFFLGPGNGNRFGAHTHRGHDERSGKRSARESIDETAWGGVVNFNAFFPGIALN